MYRCSLKFFFVNNQKFMNFTFQHQIGCMVKMNDNSCYINMNSKSKQINVINITSPISSYLD
jgi:hypothetical protein